MWEHEDGTEHIKQKLSDPNPQSMNFPGSRASRAFPRYQYEANLNTVAEMVIIQDPLSKEV